MNFLDKIKLNSRILWHSIFYGMKAADDVVKKQTSGEDGQEINQQVKPSGVFADMLEQKVTKEVEEMRDKYYRVLKEADKYSAKDITLTEETIINDEGKEETVLTFKGGVKKKTKEDFMQRPPVYEVEGTSVLLIQDVKQIEKHSMFEAYIPTGLYDYDVNITVERDFTPRFEIEKFAKRLVIRKGNDSNRSFIDMYLPTQASQFGKIDAILISNLYTIFKERNFRMDFTDFDKLSFVTEHAWNCEDMCECSYDDIKLIDSNIFDGSFVLTFDAHVIEEKKDLTEKFKTKDLDEKYKYRSPKGNTVDIFAADRRAKENNEIDIDNMSETTFKL
jgi:hypothetical protein